MSKEPLNRDTLELHTTRINRLTTDSARKFGTLSPANMLRHLRFTTDISTGEQQSEDLSQPFVRAILWILFFNLITTWPGGKIKGPDFVTPTADKDFDEEKELLLAAMGRFVDKLESDPNEKHVNPGLGRLTMRQWSHLHGIHNHHHYRQFGIEN